MQIITILYSLENNGKKAILCVQNWGRHCRPKYMLTSFLYTEPLTSYSSRRLYLENSSLDLSSCCCLSFHWVVMLQSLPLRGQLSSSGLRFCHSFSFPVSMDFPPSWVGLLPLRKKISHSILSTPAPWTIWASSLSSAFLVRGWKITLVFIQLLCNHDSKQIIQFCLKKYSGKIMSLECCILITFNSVLIPF